MWVEKKVISEVAPELYRARPFFFVATERGLRWLAFLCLPPQVLAVLCVLV